MTTPTEYPDHAVTPTPAYTDTVRANGISLHPYQMLSRPGGKGRGVNAASGIGNLQPFMGKITALCAPDSAHKCQGHLQPTDQKLPGLFLTEFGYQNAPKDNVTTTADGKPLTHDELVAKNAYWHTENTIRSWYRGTVLDGGSTRGALDRASEAGAKWMLFYHPVEFPPQPRPDLHGPLNIPAKGSFETSLFGFDFSQGANTPPDVPAVTGPRAWGKKAEKNPDYKVYQHTPDRRAYCAIREWAIWRNYINPSSDTSLRNSCPTPSSAHSGP
jgi:hypothetical protein